MADALGGIISFILAYCHGKGCHFPDHRINTVVDDLGVTSFEKVIRHVQCHGASTESKLLATSVTLLFSR